MKRLFVFIALSFCLLTPPVAGQALANETHGHTAPDEEIPEIFFEGASRQNGMSIYYDGVTLAGRRIPFEGGPHWLSMHGGGCASCHGKDGRGNIVPMMCNKPTPPITLEALLSGGHEHAGGETGEAHEQYTLQSLRRALESGIEPSGETLDYCMPRWRLGDGDFRDLVLFLSDLPE